MLKSKVVLKCTSIVEDKENYGFQTVTFESDWNESPPVRQTLYVGIQPATQFEQGKYYRIQIDELPL